MYEQITQKIFKQNHIQTSKVLTNLCFQIANSYYLIQQIPPIHYQPHQMHKSKTIIGNNKYILQRVIASGSFGKVYDCYPYAIKQIKVPTTKNANPTLMKQIRDTLQNEISILRDINHDNIVKLFQVIYEQEYVYLVMEHCQNDLKMLCGNKAIPQKKAIDIMQQVISGCKEMVRLNIVHRDLKPANILCNKGWYKLADFGMAKYLETCGNNMLDSHVGTPYYMAPQILQRKNYSKKCDIWSLGIIFYELLHGRLPWQGKDQKALLTNILGKRISFSPLISPDVKDVLSRMLSTTQQMRLTWEQLFSVFEILRKKFIPEAEYPDRITIHRTVLFEMVNIEIQRIAIMEFKKKYRELEEDQMMYVRKILESLMGEEHLYIVREFMGVGEGRRIVGMESDGRR